MSVWKILLVYFLLCVNIVLLTGNRNTGYKEDDHNPRVFLFIFIGLAVGGLLRVIIKWVSFPLPLRIVTLLLGLLLGSLISVSPFIEKLTSIAHVNPTYLLVTFLPVFMFKISFCLDAHTFLRSWGQIVLLAVPGMLISAGTTGMIMMILLGHGVWSYPMGVLFGAICSPIYPIEVAESLKGIAQAKHLITLLEGEGMIGDAIVLIMYYILLGIIHKDVVVWYQVLMLFFRFALGGIAIGFIFGMILTCLMSVLYSDVVNMSILTIVIAYLSYYVGSHVASVSGVIVVVVTGIMGSIEKTSLAFEVERFLMQLWDMLSYLANTMVFLIAGIIIAEKLTDVLTVQDIALVLVTYVVTTASRLLTYLLLAPIVSRIGYGLNPKNMNIAVWGGLRGPVPLCLAISIIRHPHLDIFGRQVLINVAALVALTLCINAVSMPLVLKLLGLSEMSIAKKVNMNNCMRHLRSRRDRTISMLKMDRFLADANWPMVHTATIMKHPYKIAYSDSDEEEENYFGLRMTFCPDCQKEIPNEPTSKEMTEMTREARMRILKAKRISYSRQYENGMLSKEGNRVLTQAVETAMDTPDGIIELDGLHRYFKRQGFIQYTRRKLLAGFFTKNETTIKPPRKYWRRICYHIITHSAFDFLIYFSIILNVIPISLEIALQPKTGTTISTFIKVTNNIFFLIYFMEFVLKIYGYSWIYVCKHGFKTYFSSYWNIFDFLILCACGIDLAMDYVDTFSGSFDKATSKASKVTLVTRLIRVIRLIRLLRLCKAWYPKLIQYCDSKIDKHLAFAYDVGKGFVTGEEEVSDMLIQMIDNKAIREDCRMRMEADRLAVTKELGLVQKDRPWIAITVKTRQAIRATLNSMSDAVLELKVSGWVDDVEYSMLMDSLEERLKYVRTKVKSVQPIPPKVMFKEVPWMSDDEVISEFLYEHVVTKIYDQGEIVCADGEMADGIYIIVTGLFKLTYIPKRDILDMLADYGRLPVIDYIASSRFEERVEDYIVSGNCIGELSVLTGRPYDCTIIADTSSQAYILTHDVVKQAFQKHPDPINGLESKMWKYLSVKLATSILMDTPAYQSTTLEKIRFQLERSFVPNLSSYKVFGVNDMMEDIILIEGVAFDYNTRECYTAPCYIPRTVQKIVLPRSSNMNFETMIESKLLIIPAKDVDEFDIMEKEEEISEMVSTASSRCLQHVIQNRQSRAKRRKKRQGIFGVGHRRVKYGESRISATQSVYLSTSRMTMTSGTPTDETELRNISINEHDGSNHPESYSMINEKRKSSAERKTSNQPRTSLEKRRVSTTARLSNKSPSDGKSHRKSKSSGGSSSQKKGAYVNKFKDFDESDQQREEERMEKIIESDVDGETSTKENIDTEKNGQDDKDNNA